MPPKATSRRGTSSAQTRAQPENTSSTNPTPTPTEPNARPSTTPAPGPGPGPSTRAPVQRLQSLKKRTPGGNIASGTRPGVGTGAGAGASTDAPGDASKPTLKYQPRAVGRRSKAEREAREKLEAQRNRERLAEAAAIQRGRAALAQRGRGGPVRGRGRGGGMLGGAAGPLGSGMAGRRGRGGAMMFDSRGTSLSGRGVSVPDGVSSDESDGEIRVSIDQINLESDADDDYEDGDDDDDGDVVARKKRKGKLPVKGTPRGQRERGLRPIRVERHEHEERVISVNMESSTSKSAELREQAIKDKEKNGDALFVQDDDEGTTTPTEADPKVKREPTDDNDQTMADVPHADEPVTTDDGLLPAQKVKVRRKLGSREPSVPVPAPVPEPEVKDPKSLLRTKEDIEEYDRHAEDLELVKEMFTKEHPTKTKETADGTEPTEDNQQREKTEEEDSDKDKLSGQLFLIQFPPITPNLIVPNADGQNADEETPENANQTASQGPSQTLSAQPEALVVKREEGVEVLDGPDESTATNKPSKVVTAADWQLQAGRAGKLNVHASGRVTMDWGGISFELDRATAVDFLQEALIVSTPPHVAETEVLDDEHKVWAMGQLSGKFTVTPDWEKML